jgi:hypothetical protein
LLVLGYLPVGEPRSLVALWKVLRLTPVFLRKRRRLLGGAVCSRRYMEYWFTAESRPLANDSPGIQTIPSDVHQRQ